MRESWEETGFEGLTVVGYLGKVTADQRRYGLDEFHDRHFYHLEFAGKTAEE